MTKETRREHLQVFAVSAWVGDKSLLAVAARSIDESSKRKDRLRLTKISEIRIPWSQMGWLLRAKLSNCAAASKSSLLLLTGKAELVLSLCGGQTAHLVLRGSSNAKPIRLVDSQ